MNVGDGGDALCSGLELGWRRCVYSVYLGTILGGMDLE